jgi:hypothetical protein
VVYSAIRAEFKGEWPGRSLWSLHGKETESTDTIKIFDTLKSQKGNFYSFLSLEGEKRIVII